jgi:hypothetical protein
MLRVLEDKNDESNVVSSDEELQQESDVGMQYIQFIYQDNVKL